VQTHPLAAAPRATSCPSAKDTSCINSRNACDCQCKAQAAWLMIVLEKLTWQLLGSAQSFR
jgi:hypothetical protein